MDLVQMIYEGLNEFIEVFMTKYQYENRGLLKKIRIDSRINMEIEEETWSKLFLYKSCYNHCAKIIILRYLEDNNIAYEKMNLQGFKKWSEFVKNISEKHSILYDVAIMDLQEDKNNIIRNIFKQSDYDLFKIDDELASVLYRSFCNVDFSKLSTKEVMQVFRRIYSLEKREELNLIEFYKKAPALYYLLKLTDSKKII